MKKLSNVHARVVIWFLVILLAVFTAAVSFDEKNQPVDNGQKWAGKACSNNEADKVLSPGELPDGYQCYFYNDGSERKGIAIKSDIRWPSEFTGEMFNPHRAYAADWSTVKDVDSYFTIKIPSQYQADISGDSSDRLMTIRTRSKADFIKHVGIQYYETNGVPMEENFPKGCLHTQSTLGGKDVERFDCVSNTNIDSFDKSAQFFRKTDRGYYWISAWYGYDSFDNFATDAILATFSFLK